MRPIARRPPTSATGSSAATRERWSPSPLSRRPAWTTAPTSLSRFLGSPSYEIQGQARAGRQLGRGDGRIEKLASQIPGVSVAWSGQSYQERLSPRARRRCFTRVSLIVVFLCLAALYESWSIPVAVLLVVPLGLVGAILFVTLRGLQNDVFLQVGLDHDHGPVGEERDPDERIRRARRDARASAVIDAAIEAARIRLRPILMTSFAFIFGVLSARARDRPRRQQPHRRSAPR